MARITGMFCAEAPGRAASAAQVMLARMEVRTGHQTAQLGGAALAAGAGGAVARSGAVIAAVDGVFLNAATLPGGVHASPAEQLAALYLRYGMTGALQRLDGDFALVVYDHEVGEAWLARDRIGVRPLYYTLSDNLLAVSSRPGGLLALPEVDRRVNERWVAVFAGSHYRYIDNRPEESPFAAIAQVPAATIVRIKGRDVKSERYWMLTDQEEFAESEEALSEQYRALLLEAVRTRVAASNRPAFTLSGGMDSSSVMASAVQIAGARQHAFSTIYTDKTYDESDEIRGFVAEKAAFWHPVEVEGFDLFDTVARMVRAHDEPVATATWLSHYLLCKRIASEGFGTVFGGLGGDELNAGEYEYFVFHFADLVVEGKHEQLAREIDAWARHHDHPIHRKNAAMAATLMQKLTEPAAPGKIRVEHTRFKRYFGAVQREYFDLAGFEPELDHPFRTCLKNRTYQDIFRETAPCCLRAEDRNCEAFGLAHSDPFFDHRLVEFMFRVPGAMKIRDGVTKQLLRRAMRGILPEETRTRVKKTGWNAPAHLWFSGRGLTQLSDMVASRAFRERGVYHVPTVLRLIGEHREIVASEAPRENHMMFLWQLLNTEMWFREVVDGSSTSQAMVSLSR